MLVPTRADCFPIVFCEASAFGLPVVTTDVGGVAELVLDARTGRVLPATADATEYARAIEALHADATAYKSMVLAARDDYERRLNWDAWGRSVDHILTRL
jgi:glycosyltransferase involved in cell wall biosynthesis